MGGLALSLGGGATQAGMTTTRGPSAALLTGGSQPSGVGAVAGNESLTFTRLVDVSCAAYRHALAAWRDTPGSRGATRHASWVGPVQVDALHAWRAAVRLPRTIGMRPIRMDLLILPWTARDDRTLLELVPRSRLRPGRAYFRAGHALMDELSSLRLPSGSIAIVCRPTGPDSVRCASPAGIRSIV